MFLIQLCFYEFYEFYTVVERCVYDLKIVVVCF